MEWNRFDFHKNYFKIKVKLLEINWERNTNDI